MDVAVTADCWRGVCANCVLSVRESGVKILRLAKQFWPFFCGRKSNFVIVTLSMLAYLLPQNAQSTILREIA